MKHDSQFTKARLTLTFWYSFVLLIILIAFSLLIYAAQNNDVVRIVLQRNFGSHVPRALTRIELKDIREQVRALRQSFRLNLLLIDSITLVLGAVLSYFLAGKTLDPIQRTMKSQKAFLADASHELRSPIAAIQTASEVVLRSEDKTKEDYRKVVAQTYEENTRLGRIVNDLLLLSRLDTEELASDLRTCSLSMCVKEGLEVMKPLLKEKQITVHTTITDEVLVEGDSDKLKQLTIILLDNAQKFTPRTGTVTVSVTQSVKPKLVVKDSGRGIPREKLPHVFKRFYQAESSRTGRGSGLGLAIAQSVMRFHNGTIGVKSIVGKGSTFTCEFPRRK